MAFSRLVNMRSWDGTLLGTTASHPEQWSWTFTPATPRRIDMDVLGITFDGARLVFSTSHSLTATVAVPLLVWVDPESQTETKRVSVGTSSTKSLLDIVWDPADDTVIALVDNTSGGTYDLIRIDPETGAIKETIAATLLLPNGSGSNVPRAICWDGERIYITSWEGSAFTAAHLDTVDALTGVLYTQTEYGRRGVAGLFSFLVTAQAPGIVHNGGQMVIKDVVAPGATVRQLYWIEADFGSNAYNKTSIGATSVVGEQTPITFDGMQYYDFDQADPAP